MARCGTVFKNVKQTVVEQSADKEINLENDITLMGSFCIGKCNRVGVTVQVDDEIHVGITKENFKEFFNENILRRVTGNA